jgi:xylan 1,4-beta-xylosidase
MLAEGGTGWNHGIAMARSRGIYGPYELDPQSSFLTARDDPYLTLQKAGHGELVETSAGEWYLAHLASRPVGMGENRRCILGRETCLQRVLWSGDGWLRLVHGGDHPAVALPAPEGISKQPWLQPPEKDDFDAPTLDLRWCTLRQPVENSWASLTERSGWLRLRGRESIHSLFNQSLMARRLQSLECRIETCLDFHPDHFTQMAGLVCYYDTRQHYYLHVTHDEERGTILGIVLTDDGAYEELEESVIAIGGWPLVYLRAEIHGADLQFSASQDCNGWQKIGPVLDMGKLSDDYGSNLRFTGAMIGIAAQDLGGTYHFADFDYFEIKPSDTGF